MRLNQLIALISASLGQALVIASAAQAQTAIPAGPSSPNALRVRPVANWIAPEPTAMGLPLPGLADQGPSGIPAGMTLAELEEIATACNPTLAQAAARIQALQGTQLQAGLYPNPVIGYVGEEMGAEGSAGQQGAFFGQTIVTAGKLGLNRAVVGHEIQQARRAWEVQLHRVLNDVRSRACEVLVAQRMIRLEEQLLRIGEVGVKTTEELLKAGEVGRVDVLLSRIEANSARLQLDNARNQYLAAWRRLTAVVGVPDMEPMPLVDELERDLPELSWEASFARLIAESPELAQARAGVQRAECAGVRRADPESRHRGGRQTEPGLRRYGGHDSDRNAASDLQSQPG
jgi:outer membrane protein TolC